MATDPKINPDISLMMNSWMKMATGSFEQAEKMWKKSEPPVEEKKAEPEEKRKPEKNRSQESLESILKTWRMVSSTLSNSDLLKSNVSGLGALPESMFKAAQTGLEGITRFQSQLLNKTKKSSDKSSRYNFQSMDEGFFSSWKDLYEKEFRKYLNIPQLGLNRFHQEKITDAMDKYNLLQTTLGEFSFVLFKPFERSMKKMQDNFMELSEKGEFTGDSKELYQSWIRTLEGDFMELYKSPEYLVSLGKTISALSKFNSAKKEVLQDLMSELPIPNQNEMDSLYKELYQLRKRISELEKANRNK